MAKAFEEFAKREGLVVGNAGSAWDWAARGWNAMADKVSVEDMKPIKVQMCGRCAGAEHPGVDCSPSTAAVGEGAQELSS